MLTGIVVTGALFAILEFSVRQTSYISQTAQATQVSRGAMTHITDELHSACLSNGFSPVQAGSSPTKLIVQNGYSEEAEVPGTYTAKGATSGKSEGVRQDTIEWNEGTGYLTDGVELGTAAEESGKYTHFGVKTTVRLATNVSEGGEKLPIFRYYKYAGSASTSTTAAASTLTEMPLATGKSLTAAEAEEVASVEVRFKTGSYSKEVKVSKAQEATIPSELQSQTTFAFSAPNSESTIQAGPCE